MSDTTTELERLRADLEVLERYQSKHDMMAGMAILNLEKEIARLEAEQADPWRDAKEFCDDYRGDKERFGVVTAYIDHLTAERDRLAARVAELERHVATAVQAGNLYRQASYQSHSGHWDSTMQRGKGCPECIRANDLRKEADEMMGQEKFPEPDDPILDPARVLKTAVSILKSRGDGWIAASIDECFSAAKTYRLKGNDK